MTIFCWRAPSGLIELLSFPVFVFVFSAVLSLPLSMYLFPYFVFLLLSICSFTSLCPLSSHYHSFPFTAFSFPMVLLLLFSSAAVWRCNPGGVSSGQSYPSAQYESGLQQRGQQGEQPGHQPRTLLHTPWWVVVVDSYPRGMSSKIRMSRTLKKNKTLLLGVKFAQAKETLAFILI